MPQCTDNRLTGRPRKISSSTTATLCTIVFRNIK